MWKTKKFSELTPKEIFDIIYARVAVFVVEQNRVYQEVDAFDPESLHLFAYEGDDLVAYSRIFIEGDHVTFGRILTTPAARGKGYGLKLIEQTMDAIAIHYPNQTIEIEAQVQVVHLYERVGFKPVGDEFLFNGTPHQRMVHEPLADSVVIHATQSVDHQGQK